MTKTIDKNTKIYISASSNPGTFGSTVFNELFHQHELNSLYIPRSFKSASDISQAFRSLQISGGAVSNPFKREIIKELNHVEKMAADLNSVNTILNSIEGLRGFNTDVFGAQMAIAGNLNLENSNITSARILGTGAVVPSLIKALHQLQIRDIQVLGRNQIEGRGLAEKWDIDFINFNAIKTIDSKNLLINAIPYNANELEVLFSQFITWSDFAFDLKVSPILTDFLMLANLQGKKIIHGYEMAVHQLIEQFKIYTGIQIEAVTVEKILEQKYLKL